MVSRPERSQTLPHSELIEKLLELVIWIKGKDEHIFMVCDQLHKGNSEITMSNRYDSLVQTLRREYQTQLYERMKSMGLLHPIEGRPSDLLKKFTSVTTNVLIIQELWDTTQRIAQPLNT